MEFRALVHSTVQTEILHKKRGNLVFLIFHCRTIFRSHVGVFPHFIILSAQYTYGTAHMRFLSGHTVLVDRNVQE